MTTQTKQQLKESIPLYSDLASLVIEFLEPCIDYAASKCNHKIAFCRCGNTFDFRPRQALRRPFISFSTERFLLEKFCPFCAAPNKHYTKEDVQLSFQFQVGKKNLVKCPHCHKFAESYDHNYCTACSVKLHHALYNGTDRFADADTTSVISFVRYIALGRRQ